VSEQRHLSSHPAAQFRPRRANPVYTPEYRAMVAVVVGHRRSAGLSQRDLAARLGRAASHIAQIESGQRRIDTLELVRIARCLEVDPVGLFDAMARSVADIERAAEPPGQ